MQILNPDSLEKTIDALNEAFFLNKTLSKSQRYDAAKWIASRQDLPGAYARMFAPTKNDYLNGIRLFTGEKVSSRAGIGHILGEEACRALILLNVPLVKVYNALNSATMAMLNRLEEAESKGTPVGMYCCGTCTASMWRHLAVGGLDDTGKRLGKGMHILKQHRDGKGKWNRFPFYYTLLALVGVELPGAYMELKYAAHTCERLLKRNNKDEKYTQRRKLILEKALGITG
ncbi:hypothetical protein JXI42_11945 [bacterium]|nr:hypothetical protein [bacterium]